MDKTSTTFEKRTVKQSRPSRRIIQNILNYSKSTVMIPTDFGKAVLIINN